MNDGSVFGKALKKVSNKLPNKISAAVLESNKLTILAVFGCAIFMSPVNAGLLDDLAEPKPKSTQAEAVEANPEVVKVEQLKQTEKPFERKFSTFTDLVQYATVNLDISPVQVAEELSYALHDPELTQVEHFELSLLLAKTQIKQHHLEKTAEKVKALHEIVELPQQRLAVFKLQFDLAKARRDLPQAVRTIEDALEFANLSISEKATRELEIETGNWYFKAAQLYLEYSQLDKATAAAEKAIASAIELEQFGALIERRQFMAKVYSANGEQMLAGTIHQQLVDDLEQQGLLLLAHQQRIAWAELLLEDRLFVKADALLEEAFKFGQTMRNRSLQLESLINLIDSQFRQFDDSYARELLQALTQLQKLPNAFGFDPVKQRELKAQIVRLQSLSALRMGQNDRALRLIYNGEPVTEQQRIDFALIKKQIMTVQGDWQKAEMYQREANALIQQSKTEIVAKHQSFLAFERNRERRQADATIEHQRRLINDLTSAVIQLKQRLSGALWLLVLSLGIAGVFYVTRQPKQKY